MLMLQKTLSLILLMAVGLFCTKKEWLTDDANNFISKVVINVANPAIMISAGLDSETDFSNSLLLYTLLAAILLYAGVIILAPLVTRLLHVPHHQAGTYRAMFVFGNIGYMGFPLISAVYGSETVLLLAIYNFIFGLLMYTYGIDCFEKDHAAARALESGAADGCGGAESPQPVSHGNQLRKVINVGTIACAFALFFFFTKLQVPSFLSSTFDLLGNLTAPLSMFVIGHSLASIRPKELISDMRINLFILIRLIVIPILGILLVRMFTSEDLILHVFYVAISVPFGSMCVMMAGQYGGSTETAARGVALSTLVSVLTIPLVGVLTGIT